jgi:hypothetical protein
LTSTIFVCVRTLSRGEVRKQSRNQEHHTKSYTQNNEPTKNNRPV